MVLEHNLICAECGREFDGVRALNKDPRESYRLLCGECLKAVEEDEETEWLQNIKFGKTLEQRVEFLEKVIYHAQKRMGDGADI